MMTDLPPPVMRSPRIQAQIAVREQAAALARRAQSAYRRLTALFVLATAFAAICSGLILYGIEASPQADSDWLLRFAHAPQVRTTLFVVQAVGLGVAAFCAYLLGARRHDQIWTRYRLEAEEGRLRLAALALELGHAQGPAEFQATGQAFLAFVHEQLDYLQTRVSAHDRSHRWISVGGAALAAIAALSSALASIENRSILAMIALIGVCTPALANALRAWSQSADDGTRGDLHRASWVALNLLYGERAEFEQAVAQHDLAGASRYADRVFDILRQDHLGFATIRHRAAQVSSNSSTRAVGEDHR